MLYESFKKSRAYAISLIILGVFVFLYNLIGLHTVSSAAVISFISGIAILSVLNASSLEIEKIRVEIIEMRKTIISSEEKINKILS